MSEWNYAEVISALITSPQPLMLFRSIKTIKVQTSSADKNCSAAAKYSRLASQEQEVFLWPSRGGESRRARKVVKKKTKTKRKKRKKKRKKKNKKSIQGCYLLHGIFGFSPKKER